MVRVSEDTPQLGRPVLYLAGPITGRPHYRRSFIAAEACLMQAGYEVLNSAKHEGARTRWAWQELLTTMPPEGDPRWRASWNDYMRDALRAITLADGVALLPGWDQSRGAAWEHRIAVDVLAIPALSVDAWRQLEGEMPCLP